MKHERKAQKLKTRQKLLAAARELAEAGDEVSVTAAAQHAGISKATAYRYFSDPAVLASEAMLDMAVNTPDALLEGADDLRQRVHIVTDYYRDFGRDREPAFRKFLGQLMADWTPEGANRQRGARRIPALRLALEPARDTITPGEFDDLVMALASCGTGFEQHVALNDVCGLNREDADRVARSVVDAILDHYLPAEVLSRTPACAPASGP
ncbi:TetR/AcrR family transcriptional regulator [Pseudodonghicola sp.]|uniref:TetR/AcrR family transcriptional regulator n=1 Tax=Pseudodonghicola sp. TaxID=1969463 RepID=UPI003A972BF3